MPGGGQRSISGVQERFLTLERRTTGDTATYEASLSSEQPVEQWFGTEILSHAPEAVNMIRAARQLPLLFGHDDATPIGRVVNVRLADGKLRGEIQFSKNRTLAKEIRADVDDGILGDVSIRYNIDEYTIVEGKNAPDVVTATRWTPLEASIVSVPADSSVGVFRSRASGQSKECTMGDETETGGAGNETAGNPTVVTELRGKRKADEERGAAKAIKAERERLAELHDIFGAVDSRFRGDDFESLREKCVTEGIKADGARKLLLDLIQGNLPEQTASTRQVEDSQNGGSRASGRDPFVSAGQDAGEKFARGIEAAILERAGMLTPAEAAKETTNEFRGRRLTDLARSCAARQGLKVNGLNDYKMLGVVLSSGRRDIGTGTEDFTGILANVTNKALLRGWESAATTYRSWVRVGNLSDFRRANRTALSGMALLDVVPENAEYKYGQPSDRTEYITAVKYGKLFSISREALINDDLNAFSQVPMMMGRAADLTINKAVYDSLGSASGTGPTLNQTGRALFNSTDANYDATSGGITVANVEIGRAKMARMLDPTNQMPLNIRPNYLLVPTALESTAKVFVASEKDPVGATGAIGGATVPNPFYNQLTVVSEAYLDGLTNGTTAWYLIANQNMHDTYEVGFVNGQQAPYLESKNGWDVDGVEYKVRIEAGIAALDFRGMYRKRGA